MQPLHLKKRSTVEASLNRTSLQQESISPLQNPLNPYPPLPFDFEIPFVTVKVMMKKEAVTPPHSFFLPQVRSILEIPKPQSLIWMV